MLVDYQQYEDIEQAILEEKRLKRWRRDWKIRLIEQNNPEWRDLYPTSFEHTVGFLTKSGMTY